MCYAAWAILKDFEKFRKISKIFDFFTIDLEEFGMVLENFGSCSQKRASKNLREFAKQQQICFLSKNR
jgi:hypothetical protein